MVSLQCLSTMLWLTCRPGWHWQCTAYLSNSDWYVVQILCRPRWLSGWSVGVALRVIFWCSPHTASPLWNKNVIFLVVMNSQLRGKYSWSTSTLFPPMDDPALPWQPLSPQPLSSQNEPRLPKQALSPQKWAYHPTMRLTTILSFKMSKLAWVGHGTA